MEKVMGLDKEFWERYGYVKVENAARPEDLQGVIDAIWEFTGKNPDDRESWYAEPRGGAGMVNMSAHQAMWNNRQSPVIYEVFKDLWQTEKIWVTLNRTNLNPPHGPNWEHAGMIHWDIDPKAHPIELRVQGVLYLTDTSANMGGFQCVPESHQRLFKWIATHPLDQPAQPEDCMTEDEITSIPGQAGDYVLWQASLLHGNGKNTSSQPRLAQYICETPEGYARAATGLVYGGEELRQIRVDSWRYGPYQTALAQAIGTPEAFIEKWLDQSFKDDSQRTLPESRYEGRLTGVQLTDLGRLLAERTPWISDPVAHALECRRKYGVTASYLPAFLMSKEIIELISDRFGVEFDVTPAVLSDLGKKLVGVDRWD